jgi:hypothetical protein
VKWNSQKFYFEITAHEYCNVEIHSWDGYNDQFIAAGRFLPTEFEGQFEQEIKVNLFSEDQ